MDRINGEKRIRNTAIQRFDRSCMLIILGQTSQFESWKELEEEVKRREIRIEIEHKHPAGGGR
jgi:hypothetical protein